MATARSTDGAGRGGDPRRLELVVLPLLAAVQFTSIVDFMVVMPLGPQLERKLGIDAQRFGLVVASYTLSAGVAGLLGSTILDRFGRRRAYLTLFAGFLVGTLLCGLAYDYITLLCSRIVAGAFGGILGGMALAIVGDVFPEERRAQATGILMSAFALASVLGVPICLSLGTAFGWHVPFLVLAAWGVPILFLVLRFLPPLRDHVDGRAHAHPLAQLRETFSQSNYQRAFAFTFAIMFGAFSVIPFLSLYLVGNVGVTETDLTWVYVVGGALTLVGAPLIGRLADQFGKLRVYRIVAATAAVLMLIATILPRVSLLIAVSVSGVLMLCNAGRMGTGMAIVTGSVPQRKRGGFMSANSAVQHLASGAGSYLGGVIIITRADHSLGRFGWVGVVGMSSTLLSLWLVGLIRSAGAGSSRSHPGTRGPGDPLAAELDSNPTNPGTAMNP